MQKTDITKEVLKKLENMQSTPTVRNAIKQVKWGDWNIIYIQAHEISQVKAMYSGSPFCGGGRYSQRVHDLLIDIGRQVAKERCVQ